MSISKLTSAVTHTAVGGVRGAFRVAGGSVRTAAWATGVAKGAAGAAIQVARAAAGHDHTHVPTPPAPPQRSEPQADVEPTVDTSAREQEPEDPRDRIPGPDVVAPEVPRPEDLPEPVVIEAGEPAGEEFHTEPKAAGRDSEHGGPPGDREEVDGYLEEVVDTTDPDVDVETPVGTTGADVATNPDTAESDLQQPGTPPVADPATVAAVISESETLRRAAERNPGDEPA